MRIYLVTIVSFALFAAACSASPSTSANPNGHVDPLGVSLMAPGASPNPGNPGTSLIGMSLNAAGDQQSFLAAESQYTGTIKETDSCAGIATVNPTSAKGPAAVFTVTAIAAGNCEATVLDSAKNSAAVMVQVTTTGGVIQ